MKEKHNISKTTISVVVDRTAGGTYVKQAGRKVSLSCVQSVSAAAYRGALRDAAFYLLEMASETDGASCTQDQVRIMWEEHKSAFN